ncbi:hypothetical protein [Methanosarcina siciliae]|uniref:hypothetical protein n=1 Tax=Methanosarcina siciliae TaxID=38027 RepID=UPI000A4E2279|nr:hypothetical protein [Methanosarcina siciliae]
MPNKKIIPRHTANMMAEGNRNPQSAQKSKKLDYTLLFIFWDKEPLHKKIVIELIPHQFYFTSKRVSEIFS